MSKVLGLFSDGRRQSRRKIEEPQKISHGSRATIYSRDGLRGPTKQQHNIKTGTHFFGSFLLFVSAFLGVKLEHKSPRTRF